MRGRVFKFGDNISTDHIIPGRWFHLRSNLPELARHAPGPLVVVCPKQDDIDDFCDDLSLFSTFRAERFPAWETDPGEQIVHDEIFGDRQAALEGWVS